MTMSKKEQANRAFIVRMTYIRNTGYGPCSDFTLAEWLEAKSFFAANIGICRKTFPDSAK